MWQQDGADGVVTATAGAAIAMSVEEGVAGPGAGASAAVAGAGAAAKPAEESVMPFPHSGWLNPCQKCKA